MTEIVLPGSVKKICGGRDREGAFAECKALSKVSSEIEHADIEAGAFFKTPFLDQTEQDFIMSGTLLIACNVKDHVVIPEKTTCICSVIFQKDVFVNSIHISKNVKYIAKDAFAGAVFKEITVDPENRWFSVSDGVLYDDKNQIVITHECCHERIRIKDGTKEILPEAFMGDSVLEYVELPDSLKKIGRGAFSYCDKLTDIKMPSAMDSIDERAFNGCSSLESIEIPDGVELLDEHTFSGCSNLKKIRIPHSVTRIGENAFKDCNKIEELLATGVMHINTCIFYESKYSEPLIFPIVMPHLVEFPSATKVFNLCRALGYLQYKEYYHDEESIGKHQKYCSSQIKSILPKIISDDNVRALQTYLSFRKVTAKSFEDNMLNPALENGAKECTAFLLAWKKDNLRTPKQKKELSLDLWILRSIMEKQLIFYDGRQAGSFLKAPGQHHI